MNYTEVKDKVLKGGKIAIERLLERKRKENSYVVVSSEKEKVVKLNARDLPT